MYYNNKLASLKDIFGVDTVEYENERLVVGEKVYPIIDDVIIILDPEQYPPFLRKQLGGMEGADAITVGEFAEDIQFTFGEEWQKFPKILPEHEDEFNNYFDIVDLNNLKNSRVCDAGCGIGRWSHFLKDKCREIVLVDFSEAIFVARRNLGSADNIIFFMGDITKLPFRDGFADLLFSLGVLHHLPSPALREVRALGRYAPSFLIYLYYALDNRPFYFRAIFNVADIIRRVVSRTRSKIARDTFTWFTALFIYLPFILLGGLLRPLGLSNRVPLYEGYRGKGIERIRQDVYDRFFTGIEQRVSRKEILLLKDTFSEVVISDRIPYWHFTLKSKHP